MKKNKNSTQRAKSLVFLINSSLLYPRTEHCNSKTTMQITAYICDCYLLTGLSSPLTICVMPSSTPEAWLCSRGLTRSSSSLNRGLGPLVMTYTTINFPQASQESKILRLHFWIRLEKPIVSRAG